MNSKQKNFTYCQSSLIRCIANASNHKPINIHAVSATALSWVVRGCSGSRAYPRNAGYVTDGTPSHCIGPILGTLGVREEYTLDGMPSYCTGPILGILEVRLEYTLDWTPYHCRGPILGTQSEVGIHLGYHPILDDLSWAYWV